jgi:hypothetical protein
MTKGMYVLAAMLGGLLGIQVFVPGAGGPLVFADIQAGDSLPPVPLWPVGPTMSARSPLNIHDLNGGSCAIVVFFTSRCGASRADAPLWEAQQSLRIGHLDVPVFWISVAQDSGAASFLAQHRVSRGFVAAGFAAHAQMGVRGTPTVYLIEGARLLSRLPRYPSEIISGDYYCGSSK